MIDPPTSLRSIVQQRIEVDQDPTPTIEIAVPAAAAPGIATSGSVAANTGAGGALKERVIVGGVKRPREDGAIEEEALEQESEAKAANKEACSEYLSQNINGVENMSLVYETLYGYRISEKHIYILKNHLTPLEISVLSFAIDSQVDDLWCWAPVDGQMPPYHNLVGDSQFLLNILHKLINIPNQEVECSVKSALAIKANSLKIANALSRLKAAAKEV